MSRSICLVLTASLALVGCDVANKGDTQYDDSRNPYYKQAQVDLGNNNTDGAITDYENALAANPKLATAHYELGNIYANNKSDPVSAIFHFKRYLELAPASDKKDQVTAMIEKQSQAFAASLPNSAVQSADDYAKLQSDNATLKATITQLQTQLAQAQAQSGKHHTGTAVAATPTTAPAPMPPAVPSATPTTPAASVEGATNVAAAAPPTAPDAPASTNGAPTLVAPRALPVETNAAGVPVAPAVDTANARTYKIVAGDSIWKIAHKMYPGDTKNGMEKIKEANKDTLPEGKPLKIGQVLIIPQ